MPKFHTASEAFVTRLYYQLLSREPGEAGLEAFSRSQEFLRRTTTDAQFLTILYHIFLNRKLDSPGFNAFLTDLQSGVCTRGNLLDIFLDSQEFAALAGFLPPPDPLTVFVHTLCPHSRARPGSCMPAGWCCELFRPQGLTNRALQRTR